MKQPAVQLDGVAAGARVVVGCSGGADSLALLVWTCEAGYDVVAVYVDHGLRANTDYDIRIVAAAADRFGAAMRVECVEVENGGNLEARARDARYDALEGARIATDAVAILVAHTRDDQAETVLLNLLRGSGTAGLAGMRDRRGLLYRPLLDVRRADTRELCARLGLVPAHDPMNNDARHRRVWLRRELLPQLEEGAARDIVDVLARQADHFRDDDALLVETARDHATTDAEVLASLPPALARRVVREWLIETSPEAKPPSSATVERVLEVARGDRVATEVPGGRRVERAGAHLATTSVAAAGQPESVNLAVPGRVQFDGVAIETWIENGPPIAWPDGRLCAVCDADAVGHQAVVRVAEEGERFRPLGRSGTKLVRDALAEIGVPASRRGARPIVAGAEPIWVVGYRIDDRVRVTTSTRRFLWLSVTTSESADP